MDEVRKALTEMNRRLYLVESGVKQLNLQVAASTLRNAASLERMEAHAESMRREADALRRDAEAMRQDAASMRLEAEGIRLEGARNAGSFDQITTEMVENLQAHQGNVGVVLEFVVNSLTANDDEHAEINRRLDALEQRLA